MKCSKITVFLTLLAIFSFFPSHSDAAGEGLSTRYIAATHMPMATPKNPPKAAQTTSKTSQNNNNGVVNIFGAGPALGRRYKHFIEVLKEATYINPILYEDGNNFALNFQIYEINTGRHLLTVSCPAPVYRFTNANRYDEDFPYLSVLFFRYAKYMFRLERDQSTAQWGNIASSVWYGSITPNFQLDGDDMVRFAGYPPVSVEYHELEHKVSTSIRAQQKEKEEAMKKTAYDYINMCLPYAPLLITVKTDAGALSFLYEKEKGYRLCELTENLRYVWRLNLYGRELALWLLDNYEESIKDMEEIGNWFYWKDINRNFVLAVSGTKVWMFPFVNENMLYPLHEGKIRTNAIFRKKFEETHPTTTDSQLVKVPGVGFEQQIFTRYLTFDEFLRDQIDSLEWKMGFRGYGDSLEF